MSPSTVSQAFTGNRAVRKETLDRVLAVATQLGYRPNAVARGLRESRLHVIALVLRPLDTLESFLPEGVDFFMRFAGSAALSAMEHGYSLMLVSDPTRDGAPISTLAADACIVTDPVEHDPVLTLLQSHHLPLLAVGTDPARPGAFPSIDSDTRGETLEMLDHLRAAGAGRVAIALGTDRNGWNLAARAAYRDWCSEHRQPPLVFENPETSGEEAGERIAAAAFDGPRDGSEPDAVYCLTGRHASGLVTAVTARGIRVPEDLLVSAGSDALQNRTSSPTVTAFDLQPEATARRAVEVAVRLIDGLPVSFPVPGPPAILHVRESTAGSAGSAPA